MIPRQSNRHAVACCGAILFASMLGGCSRGDDPYETIEAELVPSGVRIDSVSTGRSYTRVALAVGIRYYIDRTFKVASFSAALNGGVLIKTADADAYITRADHLRFTSSSATTVYVAMDKRTNRLPAWLDSTWRLTGEVFTTTGDKAASPMRLYAKSFGASVQVILGGNRQSPARGMDSNYVVIVVGTSGSGAGGAGGAAGTGGAATGGSGSGGLATGGAGTGGAATGGAATGGAATGGAATGGAATGGAATGGAATGGAATGGAATGGAATGGAATGGAATGGAATSGAATGGAATGGAATGGASGGAGGSPTPVSLYAVAHPDDDLLFINPDIETEIQANRRVRTVFTTSGDGGEPGPTLWMQREANIKKAYAAMAGVTSANPWSCATATYAGKPTTRCSLAGTLVDLIFIRLPDGRVMELVRSTAPVPTIDGATTFTQSQMLATLGALQYELSPTRVGTLDATLAYGYEHDDHIATAIFAFDAARADGVSRQLSMYRGYTVDEGYTPPAVEPANLTAAQHAEKARIFTIYNWNEQPSPTDLYDRWCWRFYPVRNVTGGPSQLHSVAGLCLAASAATDGSPLQAVACSATPSQTWTALANRVTGINGNCLGLAADGVTAVVEACTGAADQYWTLMDNGQLRGNGDTCLTASAGTVSSTRCGSDTSTSHYLPLSSQRWTF